MIPHHFPLYSYCLNASLRGNVSNRCRSNPGVVILSEAHIFGEERQVLPDPPKDGFVLSAKKYSRKKRAVKNPEILRLRLRMAFRIRLLRRTDRPAPEEQAATRRSTNRRRYAPRNDRLIESGGG